MSVDDVLEQLDRLLERRLGALEPFTAVVTAVSSGKVAIKRTGQDAADTQLYARVRGFTLAVDDEVLCLPLGTQPIVIGRLQRAAATGYALDAGLTGTTLTLSDDLSVTGGDLLLRDGTAFFGYVSGLSTVWPAKIYGATGNIDTTGTILASGTITADKASGTGLSVTSNATVGGTLAVTGNATFDGNVTLGNATSDTATAAGTLKLKYRLSAVDAPAVTLTPAAGIGTTGTTTANGKATDVGGTVRFLPGGAGIAAGGQVTVTFANARSAATDYGVLVSGNANGAALQPYAARIDGTGFTLGVGIAPTTAVAFTLTYQVIDYT